MPEQVAFGWLLFRVRYGDVGIPSATGYPGGRSMAPSFIYKKVFAWIPDGGSLFTPTSPRTRIASRSASESAEGTSRGGNPRPLCPRRPHLPSSSRIADVAASIAGAAPDLASNSATLHGCARLPQGCGARGET